jgi:2-C-methyl-D-erythritol 4-phosphate cytidylyltransferase
VATALLAAAGTGERLGADAPKALVELAGRPMAWWSLRALAAASGVGEVVIAAPADCERQLEALAAEAAPSLEARVVSGGATRSDSVSLGLAAAGDAEVVVVHDAARPLVTTELFDRCITQLANWGCDGVVAAARATDTVKEADAGGRVIATLERSRLWAVQTPQVFRVQALAGAFAAGDLGRAYDDAQLVEAAGGDVRIVEAPRQNFKVTTPHDLRVAAWLLEERHATGQA